MTDGAYQQIRMNSQEPANESTIRLINGEAIIKLDYKINTNNNLLFQVDIVDNNNDAISVITSPDGKMFLGLRKNTKIRFRLAHDKFWRFSNEFDAITTKSELTQFYGALKYKKDQGAGAFYYPAPTGTTKRNVAGYRDVIMTAICDTEGRQNTSHGFSFNVDLLQDGAIVGDQLSGAAKWLPITIDPVIKNPPGENNSDDDGGRKTTFISDI